jgi:hypothetical protein
MSYQNEIYDQTGNCRRNSTVSVVNTSSDICIFNMPFFSMSGASKIDCETQTCDLSGVSYTNILTATTECFKVAAMSADCFNNIIWSTKIYEDNLLVNTDVFYTSTNINDAPNISQFSGSVNDSLTALGYNFNFNGTQFNVTQNGFSELRVDINTELNYTPNCIVTGNTTGDTSCSCPTGYNPTPEGDSCVFTTTTAATLNGTIYTATTGNLNAGYANNGTHFFSTNLTGEIPYILTGSSTTLRTSGGIAISPNASSTNQLWDANGSTLYGRLNNCGIWTTEPGIGQPNLEWIGFSACIDINTSGTYSIGLSGDNWARFKLDGETFFTSENAVGGTESLSYWRVFEVQLTSGKHIIEMEGKNNGSYASFGAEIYNVGISSLTGMTTESQLSAVTIFTTADYRSDVVSGTTGIQVLDLGESSGYSCPAGYSLDVCGTGYTCTQLNYTDTVCVFTGTCSDINSVICNLDFTATTINSQEVYNITNETEIDLGFNFTANTSEFLDKNTTFNFKIFKYNHALGYFIDSTKFESEIYEWSSFSATSAITVSVPVSSLTLDGDYLIKSYFSHDVCTEFALLNGDRDTLPSNNLGSQYKLYEPYRDFHFVAFNSAETPTITPSIGKSNPIGSLIVDGIILNGNSNTAVLTSAESDYIISINGLTLQKDLDYTLSALSTTTLITFNDTIVSGDVLTYAYANSQNSDNIRNEGLEITSPIVSGTTNNQGNEKVYYNTTTGKYELYTDLVPSGGDIIVTINGVTLADNIDYYLSTSDSNRIILEGNLIVGDVIGIYYTSNVTIQGDVTIPSFNVSWVITNEPQNTNGLFTVEFSSSKDFTTLLTTSATTPYVEGQITYSVPIELSGSVGDVQYYRIKNEKTYEDICGNPFTTTAYSEVIDITIQTNAFNSY